MRPQPQATALALATCFPSFMITTAQTIAIAEFRYLMGYELFSNLPLQPDAAVRIVPP